MVLFERHEACTEIFQCVLFSVSYSIPIGLVLQT